LIATTAAEARQRYEKALTEGRLVRNSWQSSDADGRHLACALGVIGDKVESPKDCPASVMPTWLAQAVPGLFDNQPEAQAFAWGRDFYAALEALNGDVPFTVYHRWMAECVLPLSRASAVARPHETTDAAVAAVDTMIGLHARAGAGDIPGAEEREAARSAARSAAESAAWSAAESAAGSAAESAAWSAARSAAGSAAESAAWSAARSAAESAARSAAESAARSAAESAARSAAWSAAWSAAESAAYADLAAGIVRIMREAA
jgi:hypothetical protein